MRGVFHHLVLWAVIGTLGLLLSVMGIKCAVDPDPQGTVYRGHPAGYRR